MILSLAQKYQKIAALVLLTVFYSEFVLGNYYGTVRSRQFTHTRNFSTGSVNTHSDDYYGRSTQNANGNQSISIVNDGFDNLTGITYQSVDDRDDSVAIGGPSQPEMSSFQSVGSDNMVDLFTGDFSYNIPLLDVGGYPVNLFYRSGITMDQEASWVGLGWNINPGTVTRNLRGVPDDFNGVNDKITKTGSIKENKTIGLSAGADIEIVGFGGLGGSIGAFHNTYKGWGVEGGLNASIRAGNASKGGLTGGLSLSIQSNSQDGLTINPGFSASLSKYEEDNKEAITGTGSLSASLGYNTRSGLKGLQVSTGVSMSQQKIKESLQFYGGGKSEVTKSYINQGGLSRNLFSSSISFASSSYTPTITLPYTSRQMTFTGKVGIEAWTLDPNFFLSGYISSNRIADADTTLSLPAYGYLNYQNAANNNGALLDFNREKDIPFHEKPIVPNIGVPAYTYDLFSITGEGTGGSFRAYRSDIGYVHDHQMSTKSESDAFTLDLGFGTYFHGGVDLNLNNASTTTGEWIENNALRNSIGFKNSDGIFEATYFRNPGEKGVNSKDFYDAVGGDDVVTVGLAQPSSPTILATNNLKRYKNSVQIGTSTLSPNIYKNKNGRDKRQEVITYLTAEEAGQVGLSKYIEDYGYNKWGLRNCDKTFTGTGDKQIINDTLTIEKRVNSFRQKNHISEIDVLNPDGRRYVYGIPVYNLLERDVTASVDATKASTQQGMVKYNVTTSNPMKYPLANTDNYYNKEQVPAYAHSFLLTEILSSDYVDVTGDGISDDDLGDAIKIKYSKTASITSPYQWRAPYIKDSATYNEGLKTDKRDDRASYVYGQKELWYMNAIESKNMIATFTLDSRSDLLPADENGNKLTTNPAKRLKEINLYTKADVLKNGTNARPIKTVHFEYSYALCRGVNRPTYDTGKLTLTEVWFSYNGNTKKQNSYKFNYGGSNPRYNTTASDRWGTYKDPGQNDISTLNNAEFPYAKQTDTNAINQNAAAWTLTSIVLPSKATIKVTYESDDYAYVQNKRAMQMFRIAGFGSDTSTRFPALYNSSDQKGYLYVFADVREPVSSNQVVFDKYLQGIDKVFFKLNVGYESGYEWVPCYADIDVSQGAGISYGRLSSNPTRIWFKIKGIDITATSSGTYSPLAKAATGFLRLNLPGIAYPYSEVGDDVTLAEGVGMVANVIKNFGELFNPFDLSAMKKGRANLLDTTRSFLRLNSPNYKKYGGGLRVKKIEVFDNWKSMTNQEESKYGQQYTYTTVKQLNGVPTLISSGVASYEPSLGGEENPWRQPLEYIEKVAPMAPTSMGYTETPLGESFFPAPIVGYSQVRVRSIHADTVVSSNGYEESRFFTTYDFPTITDFTPLLDNKKRYKPAIANFLRINAKHFLAVSQGFKVELNDMNGKMRSQATYPQTDTSGVISYTENFYKVDDANAEFKHLSNTASVIDVSGNIDTAAIIGKDVELMVDSREQRSVTEGANVQVNVDVIPALFIPIPIPSLWYMPVREEDLYRSIAVTKVIQRYGLLDSIVAIDKGSRVSTKNVLYDSETGNVLLTKTQNEFNDPIYNFTYPAHWAYSGMGPAYKNIGAIKTGIKFSDGKITGGMTQSEINNYFESGDELYIINKSSPNSGCDATFASSDDVIRVWALDKNKNSSSLTDSSPDFIFLDEKGKPYTKDNVTFKIIRSGKRNMLAAQASIITTLINPIRTVAGNIKLIIDSTNNVIDAGVTEFKEKWQTDNGVIKKFVAIYNPNNCTYSEVIDCNGYLDKSINPYRKGLLGNFRAHKDLVFYGDRKEINPLAATNIRKNGTLASFKPYWNFNAAYGLVPDTLNKNWVWNTEVTKVNVRGLELENKNALNVYTAGQYGFANTKPLAISNNARYNEMFYDGFEEYSYTDNLNYCNFQICSNDKHIDFANLPNAKVANTDTLNFKAHSGKHILTIEANKNADKTINIKESLPEMYSLLFRKDTTKQLSSPGGNNPPYSGSPNDIFTRSGYGLTLDFIGNPPWNLPYVKIRAVPASGYSNGQYTHAYSIPWNFYIKVTEKKKYYFSLSLSTNYSGLKDSNHQNGLYVQLLDSNMRLVHDVTLQQKKGDQTEEGNKMLDSAELCPGIYYVTGSASESYSIDGNPNTWENTYTWKCITLGPSQDYKNLSTTNGCIYTVPISGTDSMLNSIFTIPDSKKMVFSAWVKEDQDCLCQSYTNNQISFVFPDTTFVAKPSGNIIEGWQRYDFTFTVPPNATTMQLLFQATGTTKVYFDDIRMHPYNANMQSFVYDPINLRLVAQLDENNYASFYEYDDDGTLIRVKKETERGIETIKETRSYLVR